MNKLLFAFVAVLLAATFPDTSAHAQSVRTWVSGTGTATTGCSRASPCGSFADAQTATASGGSIHCVDAGDFTVNGTLTITKSLTIDCGGTLGIQALQNLEINGAGIVVHLRNLLIDGGTNFQNLSSIGVNFINGAALYIENCTISGWNKNVANGIRFTPPDGVTSKLIVLDSTIVDNGAGINNFSGGIIIQPAGSGVARVSIDRTKIVGNNNGIFGNGSVGSGGLISVVIKDSYIANSVSNGVTLNSLPGNSQVSITLDHSASVGNGSDGIQAAGSNTYAVLTESTVIANFGTGLHSVSGGHIFSYQNNALTGNVTDTSPTNLFNLQ